MQRLPCPDTRKRKKSCCLSFGANDKQNTNEKHENIVCAKRQTNEKHEKIVCAKRQTNEKNGKIVCAKRQTNEKTNFF